MKKALPTSFPCKKQPLFPHCTLIRFASMLTKAKYNALKHLPDKEKLIDKVWKHTVLTLFLLLRFSKTKKLIFSIQGCPLKNKWTTLLDKLNSSETETLNTLPMFLLQMLLQELTLKEKASKSFWTLAFLELSENLLLPIETASVDSGMNSLNPLLRKVEGKLPLLTMIPIKLQNKNSQKTYFPLSTSTVVDKWEEEVIPTNLLKSLKIKLKPSVIQKKILDAWINTSNYVYNKAVESIYIHKCQPNFQNLRDKLVTSNTKKHNIEYISITENIKKINNDKKQLKLQLIQIDKTNIKLKDNQEIIKERNTIMKTMEEIEALLEKEKIRLRTRAKEMSSSKNEGIFEWELETPKEVRAGAVNDVCKAIKTGLSNLKAGNIKHFRLGYRKKIENHKSILLPKNFIKNKKGEIYIAPKFFKEACKFKMGKNTIKKHKNIEINNDSRICKQHNEYWLIIPVPYKMSPKKKPINYCGVDPGVRTFMTTFGNQGCTEYEHNAYLIDAFDKKIKILKDRRERKTRVTKRRILKVERKKSNVINELHWKTINKMLKMNDFIFYGDIKSHGIVKGKENSTLNRNVNNLKFYKFKERLLFKSIERSKKVYLVNEAYTTQTCSFCGNKYNPGCSKVYNCVLCKRSIGRDVNASKNILMKGIIENL